ncbi:MAG: S9 family peptidase [Mangrovibacterium sp.]
MQKLINLVVLIWAFSFQVHAQATFNLNHVQGDSLIFQQQFSAKIHPMNDGVSYSQKVENKIVVYSYQTGKPLRTAFDLDSLDNPPFKTFSSYQFSANEDKILLCTDQEAIYRHSFKANYYVWNAQKREISPLSSKGKQQVAQFSPDGERIAFVRDNNLFVKSLKFGTENQVSTDGAFNKIINGIPDWVYEEEFSMYQAYAWSPDSKFIAYVKFDESNVPTYSMQLFQELYPSLCDFKYPKSGESNSIVSVYCYDLKSKGNIKCSIGDETEQYIPRLSWSEDASDLFIMQLNRRQDQLNILAANPYTGDTRPFIKENNSRYVSESFLDNFHIIPGNKYFVIMSERNGYSHLYLYSRAGFLVKQITKGDYDVTKFYGFDQTRGLFYYQAAKENAMQREVYFISLDEKKSGKISTEQGTNDATFSSNYSYYVNNFTNLTTPHTATLYDYKGKEIRVIKENNKLKLLQEYYRIPSKEFFQFKTSEGVVLNGWMIKPNDFDSTKKYPTLMTQYSGPNSQQVLDQFNVDWYNYMAQEGFIVVCVDPRGTGARGEEFRKCTYLKLGELESDDQIEAAKYLASLSYVDENNISIWGWSYGGFMTLRCLEKGNGIFKSGIAIAPVTHWKYYDSIYTERYMRTPKMNPDGYANAPTLHANKLKGKLLLVHGTADDNVHYQNALEMSEALVQAQVPFDIAIYTNKNHSIVGGKTRLHLYHKMTDFLKEN